MQLTFKNLKQQTFKLEVDDKITVSEIIIKLKPHKPTPTGCSHLRKKVCVPELFGEQDLDTKPRAANLN